MRRHGAKNADYRGGVTCLYDTQLLGACLHASECGGRYRPGAVRGMPDVPIAPPATGPPEGWAAVGFVSPASFNRGLCARLLSVALQIIAEVHEIDGGGYWAEVPRFPGCVAQAETIDALKENIVQAVEDWLNGSPVKTEDEARELAEIQGSSQPVDESFPQPYSYRPPPSWTDEDE